MRSRLLSGVHTLTLRTGASFIGNVVVDTAASSNPGVSASNTLNLDGASTGTVALQQFHNFGHLTQTGGAGGSWTLSGTGAFSNDATVSAGTMVLDAAGTLTVPDLQPSQRRNAVGQRHAEFERQRRVRGHPDGHRHRRHHDGGERRRAGARQFHRHVECGGQRFVRRWIDLSGRGRCDRGERSSGGDRHGYAEWRHSRRRGRSGAYRPSTSYTILTAAGGITGAFARVTSNLAFLAPTLVYGANNVLLTLTRNEVGFATIGGTFNQRSTGTAVQALGGGNAIFDATLVLDAASARAAFDLLSGEVHASISGMLLDDSRFVRDAATNRVRTAFGGAGTALPVMAYGSDGAEVVSADTDRFAVWGSAFGSWGEHEGDGNAAELQRSLGGLLIGADAAVSDHFRLGVTGGFSRTSFDVTERNSSGDVDSYHIGVYGGGEWGRFGVRGGLAYSWHDIATSRGAAFAGFSDILTAGYDAGTFQAFGETGYRFDAGRFAFEPFAGLAYVDVRTDAFAEQGGAAALSSAEADNDATFTTLGVRASTDVMLGGTNAAVNGMVGWRHAFGDTTPYSSFAFAGGNAFAIAGAPIAEDAVVRRGRARSEAQPRSHARHLLYWPVRIGHFRQRRGREVQPEVLKAANRKTRAWYRRRVIGTSRTRTSRGFVLFLAALQRAGLKSPSSLQPAFALHERRPL